MAFLAICTHGQIIESALVPSVVKNAFAEGFPTIIDVIWSTNNNYYNVSYEIDQLKKIVTYDESGVYIESRAGLLLPELPTSIQEYVKLNGEGDFLKEYYKVLRADGVESYEVFLHFNISLFDANGVLTKSSATNQ